MKLFKIYPDSHPYLRTKCEEVSLPVSSDIKKTLLDMIEYLKKSQDDEFATKIILDQELAYLLIK